MTMQQVGDVAAKIVDRWAWWTKALADPNAPMTVHPSDPQQGYYRVRRKGEQWEPVAIFYPDGSDEIVGYRNGQEVREVNDLWVWACREPITYEAYEKAMAGGGFDDEPPVQRGLGDNSEEAEPFDAITVELAGEIEQIQEFLKKPVTSQTDADRIGIWAKRLTTLATRADDQRKIEKEPHLSASRDVDDKWRTPINEAKDWAAKAKKHVEPFLIAKKRAEEERLRKAREEAEAAQRAAAEAAKKLQETKQLGEQERLAAEQEAQRLADAAAQAERDSRERKTSAGRTGARVSIRTEKIGVVTDYKQAAIALVEMKHPDMIDTIERLANRAAKAGMPFAGIEIKEQEKVQ